MSSVIWGGSSRSAVSGGGSFNETVDKINIIVM